MSFKRAMTLSLSSSLKPSLSQSNVALVMPRSVTSSVSSTGIIITADFGGVNTYSCPLSSVTFWPGSTPSVNVIGFARRFNGATLIEKDKQRRNFLFGSEKESITVSGLRLDRVDMVDPAFEERFTVWSNDQVEARYLVHPEYVERLTALETAFGGDNMRALFKDGSLLVVLENGNQFESGSLDSADDRDRVATSIAQFGALAELATRLNEKPRAGFS